MSVGVLARCAMLTISLLRTSGDEVEICLSTNHVRAGFTTAEPLGTSKANNELEVNSAEPVAREGFRTR